MARWRVFSCAGVLKPGIVGEALFLKPLGLVFGVPGIVAEDPPSDLPIEGEPPARPPPMDPPALPADDPPPEDPPPDPPDDCATAATGKIATAA